MTFTSAVLGAVQHPTNILTEYLSRFRGTKKFKAYILSWLDGWLHTKLQQGKPPWVYVVNQELAEALGCCRDTVFRHLKDLCKMGILKKSPYKRWSTDNIWAYSIDFDRLKQELASSTPNAHQIAECRKSDSRESEISQPSAENQTTNRSLTLNSSAATTEHSLPVVAEEKKAEILREAVPAAKISKKEQPTEEELNAASRQISALTTSVKVTLQVRGAIAQYWASFPAALERLKTAVQENWRVDNLTGVLIKALKEGVSTDDAAPPCTFYGWKEWANEATRRRLMEYSESQNGDIRVHFVGGASRLWSEVRSLTWLELEKQLH
ncbi:MAG: hypothetical protein ACRCZS_08795 [Chroococcidiopsis sp.]